MQRAGVDGSSVGLAEVRHVDLTECHAVVFKRHPLAPCDRTRQGGGVRHRHVAATVAPLSVAHISDGTCSTSGVCSECCTDRKREHIIQHVRQKHQVLRCRMEKSTGLTSSSDPAELQARCSATRRRSRDIWLWKPCRIHSGSQGPSMRAS